MKKAQTEIFIPIDIAFNKSSFNYELGRVERIKPILQKIATSLSNAGIDVRKISIPNLLQDPYREILPFQPEMFQTIAKAVASMSMLAWGSNEQTLINTAQEAALNSDVLYYHHFYTISDGEVMLNKTEVEILRSSHVMRTRNDKQNFVYEKLAKACQLINEANEAAHIIDAYSSQEDLAKPFKKEDGKYVINTDFLLTINQ